MSTINLPPLPTEVESVHVSVDGLSTYREARDCYYTMDQMYAYAEQAVREALASQVPVAWMTEDGRVSTDATKQTAMPKPSRLAFCIPLAIIPESSHE